MEVQEKVIGIIAKKLEDDPVVTVAADSRLEDFGDSLTKLDILCDIEEAFQLPRTPDPDLKKLLTVQDIIDYVQPAASNVTCATRD